MILLLLGGCVRGEAAPGSHRGAQDTLAYVDVCRDVTLDAALSYRPSARSPQRPWIRVFPGRATGAVEAAHVPVHSPGVLPLPNTQ